MLYLPPFTVCSLRNWARSAERLLGQDVLTYGCFRNQKVYDKKVKDENDRSEMHWDDKMIVRASGSVCRLHQSHHSFQNRT